MLDVVKDEIIRYVMIIEKAERRQEKIIAGKKKSLQGRKNHL